MKGVSGVWIEMEFEIDGVGCDKTGVVIVARCDLELAKSLTPALRAVSPRWVGVDGCETH